MSLPSAQNPPSRTRVHRRYPRVELSAVIGAQIQQSRLNRDQATGGALTILGVGGAFVQTRHPFEIGTRISVRFALPGSNGETVCDALIRTYIPHRGIGIEFVRISHDDRERLRAATWELADTTNQPHRGWRQSLLGNSRSS